jgi:hypothetical protein
VPDRKPGQPHDRETVLELVALHEGDQAAVIAASWWDTQPESFTVLRDGSSVTGVVALIDLTEAPPRVRDADPGARAAWDHAQRTSAPRPNERVTQTRIVIDRSEHQRPSATHDGHHDRRPTRSAIHPVIAGRRDANSALAFNCRS